MNASSAVNWRRPGISPTSRPCTSSPGPRAAIPPFTTIGDSRKSGFQPVVVPFGSKRPCDLGGLGSLQVFMCSAEANRTTTGDLPQSQTHFKLQSKNFFDLAHGQSPGWQADPPFRGDAFAVG